jgi:hypothetical protein
LSQIRANKPKNIVLRQWEYNFWYDKMPEVLDHITAEYFLDEKIHNFYIFASIDNVNWEVRRANRHYWNGKIEEATLEYLKALETQRKNPDLLKILTRLFKNEVTSQRALNSFEGVYIQKASESWKLRWGDIPSPIDSGRIRIAAPEEAIGSIVRLEPFPDQASAFDVVYSGGDGQFVSRSPNDVSGLDILFVKSHPVLTIEFDLKREGSAVQKAFVTGRGVVVTDGTIRLKKQKK